MPSDYSKKIIVVETKTNKHKLKASEYARWFCLIEALDIVSRKAQQFKVDLQSKDADWVKPLAFQKYIDERYESMLSEVLTNEEPINITTKCITSLEPVSK